MGTSPFIEKFKCAAMASALAGCAHHRAPIHPIARPDSSEIEMSTMSVTQRTETSAANPEKAACEPQEWRAVHAQGFAERERWLFDVHWGAVKAGEATLEADGIESVRGRSAYHLSMDIRALGMAAALHPFQDRTDSWLDRASLTTLLIRHAVRESHYQADETSILDPSCRRFQTRKKRLDKPESENSEGHLPVNTLDVYGILFYLRTLPLATGQTYDLELFTGNKAVPVTAFIREKERLKVGAGTYDCFPIDLLPRNVPQGSKIRQMRWWIGTDAAHSPVRIRMDIALGHITADLRQRN